MLIVLEKRNTCEHSPHTHRQRFHDKFQTTGYTGKASLFPFFFFLMNFLEISFSILASILRTNRLMSYHHWHLNVTQPAIFMTDAARREQESLKKKIQPKLSLTLSSSVSRGNVSTPPRHSSGSLTPPVTPPITPSSSFRSSTPTGSEYDEEEVDYEESDSDESWTTESAISSEAILSSMCMNGGEEKPFACPVPGCKKRYKNVNGIKYHAKNGHRTQIRVRKPFKCRCGKSYKTAQGLRHHTINFHPPVSAEIIRKMQQ
uniref:JAZF zinc finger 1 n=1 Tax=Bos mutus grunniens TaxID=30521 RepID=A0A8C0A3A8_BOSMU